MKRCQVCGDPIRVMARQGGDVCSNRCAKLRTAQNGHFIPHSLSASGTIRPVDRGRS